MKASPYRKPDAGPGRFAPWFEAIESASGVYVIRDRHTDRVLYVGESHTGRLAKTIKRHLYSWDDDPERVHQSYRREVVEVSVRTGAARAAVRVQNRLIQRLQPRDNVQGFDLDEDDPF